MPAATIESAALLLVAARRARRAGARLPESLRPPDFETALAIQQRVTELLGLPIGGWKCSLPAADRPVAVAPIYPPTICERSPCAFLPIGGMARVEPEIAFAMAHDLPQRTSPYTEAEVLDAVGEPRLVLELIGPRYADPGVLTFLEVLADAINNQGLYVGPPVQGRHGDGHPLKPLVWLANFLATRGEGLRAGQIVTTGSYCGVIDVPLNKALTVNFGTLGALSVEFNAAA
ncbi:MAG: 2-keto-4-pentenoate hydratase [Betaproteobacteria bacterium]|nr:MAG: 2-keto-4-pentenoate hydratase [Betaproteobacteria bacterium]